MSDEADPKALLRDLQQMSEAGRDRFFQLLPREEIIEIVKASLRERDEDRSSQGSSHCCACHTAQGQPADSRSSGKTEVLVEPITVAMTERAALGSESEAEEHTMRRNRWCASPLAATIVKRARHDPLDFLGLRNPQAGPQAEDRSATRTDDENSIKFEDDNDSNGNSNDEIWEGVHENSREKQVTETALRKFPIMLSIPKENGTATLMKNLLPHNVSTTLRTRFEAMCTANEGRRTIYKRMMSDPHKYVQKPMCVRDILLRGRESSAQGLLFRESHSTGADDRCVKAKEPCMYLILHNGQPTLCTVPLPEDLRMGMTWRSMGFWVQQ
jgi:hypothetical protein